MTFTATPNFTSIGQPVSPVYGKIGSTFYVAGGTVDQVLEPTLVNPQLTDIYTSSDGLTWSKAQGSICSELQSCVLDNDWYSKRTNITFDNEFFSGLFWRGTNNQTTELLSTTNLTSATTIMEQFPDAVDITESIENSVPTHDPWTLKRPIHINFLTSGSKKYAVGWFQTGVWVDDFVGNPQTYSTSGVVTTAMLDQYYPGLSGAGALYAVHVSAQGQGEYTLHTDTGEFSYSTINDLAGQGFFLTEKYTTWEAGGKLPLHNDSSLNYACGIQTIIYFDDNTGHFAWIDDTSGATLVGQGSKTPAMGHGSSGWQLRPTYAGRYGGPLPYTFEIWSSTDGVTWAAEHTYTPIANTRTELNVNWPFVEDRSTYQTFLEATNGVRLQRMVVKDGEIFFISSKPTVLNYSSNMVDYEKYPSWGAIEHYPIGDVWKYNIASKTFTQLGATPSATSDAAVCYDSATQKFYCAFGRTTPTDTAAEYSSTIYSSTDGNTWSVDSTFPTEYGGRGYMPFVGSKVNLLGGYRGEET
jgi:hypothetical protein